MNKLTVLAGTGAVALVVAATATTPALAYQGHYDHQMPRHSTSQKSSDKKNCPPKKTHETPQTPPKQVEHKKKQCPPKKVVKKVEKLAPQKQAPIPDPVEPVSTTKPEAPKALPNAGAGDMLFPAAGITGALGYAGNLIRLKRKNLQ